MGDFNEDLSTSNMAQFMEELGLHNLLQTLHPSCSFDRPTRIPGSTEIGGIFATPSV